MLNKNQKKRINNTQTNLLKNHPWCKDIDWKAVIERKPTPPFSPSIEKSNFDPEYVRAASIALTEGLN
jgi:serine/threonine protein kinase SCH9